MTLHTNDLFMLMEKAAQDLHADNWHSEAVVMEQAADRLRILAQRLRKAGLSAEEDENDPGRQPRPDTID
jgi:hypothetical protein